MSRPVRTDVLIGALAALFGAAGAVAVSQGPLAWVGAAVLGGALGLYRTHPAGAAALAVAAALALVPTGDLSPAPAILVCANAFAAGRWTVLWASVATAVALVAASLAAAVVADNIDGWLVPAILLVGTAWIAGRAIRERDLVAIRLAERAEELEREREAFATLSVRYERARIASELHDIVAHAISVMVVQAGAGQRIAAIDPELTGETFQAIAGAARQAERDMTQLVALLAADDAIAQAPDLTLVEELVARAAGSGLDVTLRLEGSREGLPAAAVQTVYRVVRESLTNALRYASGAPVHVLVRGGAGAIDVEVVNDATHDTEALAGHGTGNGLRGLRERVGARGGRLEAGPRESGGWRVAARIPCAVAVAVDDGG
ncbi:MAG: sensor histidine kinase [Solirubrobacteraceae bacterium]